MLKVNAASGWEGIFLPTIFRKKHNSCGRTGGMKAGKIMGNVEDIKAREAGVTEWYERCGVHGGKQ